MSFLLSQKGRLRLGGQNGAAQKAGEARGWRASPDSPRCPGLALFPSLVSGLMEWVLRPPTSRHSTWPSSAHGRWARNVPDAGSEVLAFTV